MADQADENNEDVKKLVEDNDKLVEEIFQHEDKDKNGFISHEEFSGPKHDELWGGSCTRVYLSRLSSGLWAILRRAASRMSSLVVVRRNIVQMPRVTS